MTHWISRLAAPVGLALGVGLAHLGLGRTAPAARPRPAHGPLLSSADLTDLLRRCRPEGAIVVLTPGADDVSAGHAAAAWRVGVARTAAQDDAAALALRAVDYELMALASARGQRVEAGPGCTSAAAFYSYLHARRALRPAAGPAVEVNVWAVRSGDVLTVVLQCGETGLPLSRRAP
jgi:hypothetical protein